MKLFPLLAAVLLSACVTAPPMTIPQAETRCANQAFPAVSNCIRQQLETAYPAWRSNPTADLADVYLAWLEAAGKRVERGEMDEAEARLGAATLRMRLKEVQTQRYAQAAYNQQQAMSTMLTGLALINAASAPQVQPNMPITCTSTRSGAFTNTVCH